METSKDLAESKASREPASTATSALNTFTLSATNSSDKSTSAPTWHRPAEIKLFTGDERSGDEEAAVHRLWYRDNSTFKGNGKF